MKKVTLIPGDGIGPEISEAVLKIIKAAGVEIDWDVQSAGADVAQTEGTPLPQRVIDSIRKNKVALKAPVTTPIGKGFRSADAECALGEVGLGGQAVFNADLIPFQLGVGIINVVFQDGRERSGSDVVHQIEKVADERTLEQGVLRFIGRACPCVGAFAAAGDTRLCT